MVGLCLRDSHKERVLGKAQKQLQINLRDTQRDRVPGWIRVVLGTVGGTGDINLYKSLLIYVPFSGNKYKFIYFIRWDKLRDNVSWAVRVKGR